MRVKSRTNQRKRRVSRRTRRSRTRRNLRGGQGTEFKPSTGRLKRNRSGLERAYDDYKKNCSGESRFGQMVRDPRCEGFFKHLGYLKEDGTLSASDAIAHKYNHHPVSDIIDHIKEQNKQDETSLSKYNKKIMHYFY